MLSSVEDDAPESEELALSELEELGVLGVLRSNFGILLISSTLGIGLFALTGL
ncbi:hypothetical protein SK143_2022 [Streptococcus oralis]|uniref:Uncharacterized protein n=1 Tax=Streptococcus oralis TaxID=1303 RepID=A0A081R2C3_STROR|nr:hypothetical protein SK143_2022 [Streptococcus oralis]